VRQTYLPASMSVRSCRYRRYLQQQQ